MKRITVLDQHEGGVPGLASVVRAIQQQVQGELADVWGVTAELRLVHLPRSARDEDVEREIGRGDGIIYVSPEQDMGKERVPQAFAYHCASHTGLPSGYVFPSLCSHGVTPWTVALSHEVLEMLVDPDLVLFVAAPHPADSKGSVLRPYEVCDPVEAHSYLVDNVRVADFVTPQYFKLTPRRAGRRDVTHYLREPHLPSLGLLPGGYYSYFDFRTGLWHDHLYGQQENAVHEHAAQWAEVRSKLGWAPRGLRRKLWAADGELPNDDSGPFAGGDPPAFPDDDSPRFPNGRQAGNGVPPRRRPPPKKDG